MVNDIFRKSFPLSLFKKAVTLTDVHFGRSGNSEQACKDNLDFIAWFIEEAKTFGADTCIMMGDWHDNRHNLNVLTMSYSLKGMEMLNDAFKNVFWIEGNHDLFYRDRREVTSVIMAKHLSNIHLIDTPTVVDGVQLLPWLIGDEGDKAIGADARYTFGHLELGGFMMNAKVEMPIHEKGMSADSFKGAKSEFIFSGHYHFRQSKGKVIYTGNTFPFNFSDAGDDDRGMMFLEWGKDPFFKAWPAQPLFRNMTLLDMITRPDALLRDKMTVRASMDVSISFEESQFIKEELIKKYSLRKLELVPVGTSVEIQNFSEPTTFQSVDQIVTEGLLSVQSKTIKPEMLVEIYRTLAHI